MQRHVALKLGNLGFLDCQPLSASSPVLSPFLLSASRLHVLNASDHAAQKHVGSRELVNDTGIAGLTPKIRKPAAYDALVVFFFRHDVIPFW